MSAPPIALPRDEFALAKWRGAWLFRIGTDHYARYAQKGETQVKSFPACAPDLPPATRKLFQAALDELRQGLV